MEHPFRRPGACVNATPAVSVVIPTHNRAHYLQQAIASALNQVDVDVEVIVVDDGSEDATPTRLAEYEDDRIRVVRFDRARGQSAARNAGIEAARAPWVAFLDDDDLWAPNKLRLQLDAARAAGANWVYCGALLVSPDGDVVRMWGPPDPTDVLRQLLRRNVVQAGASTVMAATARVRAVGGFDETLGPLGDRDLWIRLAADGVAASVADPLVAYRRHGTTVTGASGRLALAEADRVGARYEELASKFGVELDRSHLAQWFDSELLRSLRTRAMVDLRNGRRGRAFATQMRALAKSRSLADTRRLARIVAGERARRAVRRAVPRSDIEAERREPVPEWLAPYLEQPALR